MSENEEKENFVTCGMIPVRGRNNITIITSYHDCSSRQISNFGNLRKLDKTLCSNKTKRGGYITNEINGKLIRRHILVKYSWHPNPCEFLLTVVDHINGDPLDNRLCNLQYLNNKLNILKATKNNKGQSIKGYTKHGKGYQTTNTTYGKQKTFDTQEKAKAHFEKEKKKETLKTMAELLVDLIIHDAVKL